MRRILFYHVLLLSLLFPAVSGFAEEPNETLMDAPPVREVKAFVVSCEGMIDDGLFKSIQRRTQTAIEQGGDYVIYEISTYGGLVKAADDISKYFILEASKNIHTVAFVKTEAISAGSMISASCQDIIMAENTTIGDSAPITPGGKLEGVEREKAESFVRATFKRAAEANGYPEPLLLAMVTMDIEVYRVKNLQTGEFEFFEGDDLPSDPNAYAIDEKERIDSEKQLLTLTASEALEYGLARAVVEDRSEALAFIEERDGVVFNEKPKEIEMLWSESMVRWINSPAVMGILVMLAVLGIYVEISTPGLGLPGLLGVICIVIIVGSKFLYGLANWVEIAIFFIGAVLLLIEIFVIPGFGIAGITGLFCMVLGAFGMLIRNPPDKIPWPQTQFDWDLLGSGVLSVIGGLVLFVIFAVILSHYLPKLQFMSGLFLTPTFAADAAGKTKVPAGLQSVQGVKVGDIGTTATQLHPAGKARFEGKLVDVVSRGEFVETQVSVCVVEIHGSRVVVEEKNKEDLTS